MLSKNSLKLRKLEERPRRRRRELNRSFQVILGAFSHIGVFGRPDIPGDDFSGQRHAELFMGFNRGRIEIDRFLKSLCSFVKVILGQCSRTLLEQSADIPSCLAVTADRERERGRGVEE